MNSTQLVSILQIISNSNSLNVLSTIANGTSVKSKVMKDLLIYFEKTVLFLDGRNVKDGPHSKD
jgi:hypothetical protein